MMFAHRRHPQEHEDNRLRRAAQHFHGVLYRCMRFMRDIRFDVVFHRYAAKSDPVHVENLNTRGSRKTGV